MKIVREDSKQYVIFCSNLKALVLIREFKIKKQRKINMSESSDFENKRLPLRFALSTITTIGGEECTIYRLSQDKTNCRMSKKEMEEYMGDDFLIRKDNLEKFLMRKGLEQLQESQGSTNKGRAINLVKKELSKMDLGVKEEMGKLDEQTSQAVRGKSDMKVHEFVKGIEQPRLGERLDALLGHLAKGSDRLWAINLLLELLGAIEVAQTEVDRHFKKCKDALAVLLQSQEEEKEEETREAEFSLMKELSPEKFLKYGVQIHSFSKEDPLELKEPKRNRSICDGPRGISRKNGTTEFAALDWKGSLVFFDGVGGNKKKEFQVPHEKKDKNYGYSSVEFSPDGTRLLVSASLDKSLMVLDAGTLEIQQKWINPSAEEIRAARWVDNERILAGYSKPGEMLLFQLKNEAPLMTFKPEETAGGRIYDFDFSADKKCAFVGSDGLVFKMSIEKSNNSLQWKHPSGYVTAVRLSSDQRMVCSCNWRKEVQVNWGVDGTLLSTFKGFSHSDVNGILWSPDDRVLLAWSFNELVLLRVGSDGKSLEKLDEIKKQALGDNWIYAANAFWGEQAGEKITKRPFVALGNLMGQIYRVYLK